MPGNPFTRHMAWFPSGPRVYSSEMTRLLRLLAPFVLCCAPSTLYGQGVVIVELADLQVSSSSSVTVEGPTSEPLGNVVVDEFSSDWKTILCSTKTNAAGVFSLVQVRGRRIHHLQLSAPGFNPQRVRVKVDSKRGKHLKLKLTLAT